jgi:flavodoxin/NAD-dependent dihydropyrimidine dehydrogenase PreA subunit
MYIKHTVSDGGYDLMILYFSGTGNSRYTAQLIGRVTGDTIVSINELVKSGSKEELHSEKPFVFVCPTYAWRIPRLVEDFIKKNRFNGNAQAYFVLTCGDAPGNAAHYAEKTCKEKRLAFLGLASVVMPENYIALFDVPSKAQANAILQKANARILEIAEHIKNDHPLPREKLTLVDRIKSGIVNNVFYPFFVNAKGFYSTDACTGCGKCSRLCPLNNIKLTDGKPRWGQSCTHCMACICGCPCEAIEYKHNSQGKPRYYNTETPQG